MAARVKEDSLEDLLGALISDRIVYFPIRHHSPACARHLEHLIRERKPQAVLIEGPASFTSLIPLVLHPKTKAPFAIYTSFVREQPDLEAGSTAAKAAALLGLPRHAAYYPFCDYSPELVGLRVGAEVGASLRFVDLDYPDQVLAEREAATEAKAPRVESLLAERHFKRSRYLQALARRAGCRDHNDLWDHLFETRLDMEAGILPASESGFQPDENDGRNSQTFRTKPEREVRAAGCRPHWQARMPAATEAFIRDVAAWCHMARADATAEELEMDGTLAREAAMAATIGEELAKGTERIIVVTGGFHTVVLPKLVGARQSTSKPATQRKREDALDCLIRYSFEQLDELNGYAAGMPSPYYYDQLWHAAAHDCSAVAFADVAARILVDLGQLTRRKKLAVALSPADEIAALEQSRRLASMRGHPGPTREDLLDGIRSCFVKGSMDAEGEIVLGLAQHALGGTSIGDVPPEAGVPPLVEDFRVTAQKLRLNIKDSVRRKGSLDLYRKAAHRQSSRFFHSLTFLEVPFAAMAAGPDFVKGVGLERLFEHWSYQWTPQTESRLVEASIYGTTVEEAAANRLAQAIVELENTGRGRCASEAVAMLVNACRMGLHRHTGRLLTLIGAQVNEDPSLVSLTNALNQLVLLWESREPLEAHRLTEIPALIQTAFERACYLLHNLADTPAEAANEILQSLITIRDLLRSSAAGNQTLDASLFYEPLARVFLQPKCPALLAGGVTGLLHGDGRLAETELFKLLAGSLNAASTQVGDQTAFLIGLLRACRELAWRQPALVEAVEKLLSAWTEEEFIQRIPHLRMAFADLTPREADQVATVVAGLHGGEKLGALHRPEISEAEILAAVRVNVLVMQALEEDGLGSWTQSEGLPEIRRGSSEATPPEH